jgi:hypothetical protein
MILRENNSFFLDNTNQLLFVMESCYVFFEVGDKVFNFMQMSFAFKALIILHSDQLAASLNNPQINNDSPE